MAHRLCCSNGWTGRDVERVARKHTCWSENENAPAKSGWQCGGGGMVICTGKPARCVVLLISLLIPKQAIASEVCPVDVETLSKRNTDFLFLMRSSLKPARVFPSEKFRTPKDGYSNWLRAGVRPSVNLDLGAANLMFNHYLGVIHRGPRLVFREIGDDAYPMQFDDSVQKKTRPFQNMLVTDFGERFEIPGGFKTEGETIYSSAKCKINQIRRNAKIDFTLVRTEKLAANECAFMGSLAHFGISNVSGIRRFVRSSSKADSFGFREGHLFSSFLQRMYGFGPIDPVDISGTECQLIESLVNYERQIGELNAD